ncbi:hypothetical protein CCS01_11320 [Rhodopila globiformis]|uniref:Uncharacterized protein n=2 Tax=Rhodopila globiformis TaxID=1071 RepID=A0A2S6NIA0_RHOGL|nr:hypothetical protein CCS01_11320 [Rhodopila globiformis]
MLCAAAVSAPLLAARAEPTGTQQSTPGLADTPGTAPSIAAPDQALSVEAFKVRDGRALLDSAVLLKVYYYAYATGPVDYSAILTENTQDIVPPPPVRPTLAQKQTIDALIRLAKSHPDILIVADDVTLESYDKSAQSYTMNNRLFIGHVGYYFDNSPFHYVYPQSGSFHKLHCTDATALAAIDSAIDNYQPFSVDIAGHVTGTRAADKVVAIEVQDVVLKDGAGKTLLTQGQP